MRSGQLSSSLVSAGGMQACYPCRMYGNVTGFDMRALSIDYFEVKHSSTAHRTFSPCSQRRVSNASVRARNLEIIPRAWLDQRLCGSRLCAPHIGHTYISCMALLPCMYVLWIGQTSRHFSLVPLSSPFSHFADRGLIDTHSPTHPASFPPSLSYPSLVLYRRTRH